MNRAPRSRPLSFLAMAGACAMLASLAPAGDVAVNGGFDDKQNPLKGWHRDFQWTGKKIWANNHNLVDVLSRESGRRSVLQIHVGPETIERQGVMVESDPIPFDPEKKYLLKVDARTTGPNCRIFLEGYRLERGATREEGIPHLSELRKVFRQAAGRMVYFGGSKSGVMSNPTGKWSTGQAETFPPKDLGTTGMRHIAAIEYLVIHILAIMGTEGDILIDAIELRER